MTDNKKIGEVQIANEVVASIAGISAVRSRRCGFHGRRHH